MTSFSGKLAAWRRWIVSLLLRARLPILALAAVVSALVASLWLWPSEPSIRLWGLLLQLFGIGAAAIGIRDTRRKFGKPTFLQLLRNGLKSSPLRKPRVISEHVSESMTISSSASAHVWRGVGRDSTIESRLSVAEANLKELCELVTGTQSAFDTQVRVLSQSVRDEKDQRQQADEQLILKIDAASTDGLYLAAVGATWLACGVVMSTAAPELLKLVV